MPPFTTRIWRGTPDDREQAEGYSEDDLAELEEIYAADTVIRRLLGEIEQRKWCLRAQWTEDQNAPSAERATG